MANKKQRDNNRDTATILKLSLPPKDICTKCGKLSHGGHYVPPFFGEAGFWACAGFADENEPTYRVKE